MSTAHRNAALNTLDGQLKARHPGLVIGWVADNQHDPSSGHYPDPDGTVDALDPMIGPHYTRAQAQAEINAIVASRDPRVAYIIWESRIISSTVSPWKWRPYSGAAKDPHTGHWHISSDQGHETNARPWQLDPPEDDMQLSDKISDKAAPNRTVVDVLRDVAKVRGVLVGDAKDTANAALPKTSPLAKVLAMPAMLAEVVKALGTLMQAQTLTNERLRRVEAALTAQPPAPVQSANPPA